MRRILLFAVFLLAATGAFATVFGGVRGIVHDPQHRPVPAIEVIINARASDYTQASLTDSAVQCQLAAVALGEYTVTLSDSASMAGQPSVTVLSGTSPVLHLELRLPSQSQTVTVSADAAQTETVTPTSLVDRLQIQEAPGASRSNSLAMVADFVPGAYLTHDLLHIRGGHQVSWLIDGVPVPNTSIASNVGVQFDPKDIDYLEVQRGGYSSDYGDRTYGVFNVVPRTGFERNNEAELFTTFGTFHQTNDQVNFGSHTEKFAYYASVNGNRSDYGLETPGPDVLHDRVWGLGGMGTLIYNRDANNQIRFITSLRRDDYQIPNDPNGEAAGRRDLERERDALASFSWAHTFRPGVLLTVSPFYHYNRANYDGDPNTVPVSTTQHRGSQYAGAQIALSAVTARHNARVGIYGFGQRDDESIKLVANDGSGDFVASGRPSSGHQEAIYLEDQYKAFSWLTLTAGLRFTHFTGAIAENAASPRLGGAIRIPHLNWVLRGF